MMTSHIEYVAIDEYMTEPFVMIQVVFFWMWRLLFAHEK